MLQVGKEPCKYFLVYPEYFLIHNVNQTPHHLLIVLIGNHYKQLQQPGAGNEENYFPLGRFCE